MDYMAVALFQTLESVKSDLAKDTIQAWKWHGMSDQIFREIEHWLVIAKIYLCMNNLGTLVLSSLYNFGMPMSRIDDINP